MVIHHDEIWKKIPDYPTYEVSNYGRIKSLPNYKRKTTRILRPPLDRDGYRTIVLCNNGEQKRHKLHHLVANVFIRPRMQNEEIDHINGNRQDNRPENLRWVKRCQNMQTDLIRKHMSEAKYRRAVVCIEDNTVFSTTREAARITGIPRSSICNSCKYIHKTAGGKHWQYKEN